MRTEGDSWGAVSITAEVTDLDIVHLTVLLAALSYALADFDGFRDYTRLLKATRLLGPEELSSVTCDLAEAVTRAVRQLNDILRQAARDAN